MRELIFDKNISWVGRELKPDTGSTIETIYFSLDFNLLSTDGLQSDILISAHSRYKLYINGEFVTFGPCKSDEFHRYCEKPDITPFIKPGANRILVKVTSYPPREKENGSNVGPYWSYNKACGACLFVSGELTCGKEHISVSTGIADWKYTVSEELTPFRDYMTHWLGYMEIIDGAKYVQPSKSFPEGKPVVKRFNANGSPYGELAVFPLYERAIPLLYLEEKSFKPAGTPVDIAPNTKKSIILDAGELTTGFPRIRISGGEGATLTIRYCEAYFFNVDGKYVKRVRDDASGVIHGHADTLHHGGGELVYEPFWFRTFRYIEITVETADHSLHLYDPKYIETGYPLEAITALGDSTDDWVSHIYDLSLRTLRRCMHETYEDCPYYEQLQYTMDTRLQMLFTYAINGDIRPAKKTIYEYHASKLPNGMLQSRYPSGLPQVIPVFSLHWIFMLGDYYMQTGDKSYIRGFLGTVDQILCYFRERKKDNLATKLGYWETVDWAAVWDDNVGVPHACNHGASTIQNLQYTYALQKSAELVELFGFNDLAASYRKEADEIIETLMDVCWNGQLFMEGPGFEEYSQHSQMWAVLCKIGDAQFRKNLLDAILNNKDLIPCSFPTIFYMFRAFEQESMYDETAMFWDYWKVLLPLGLTTVPETSFGNPRSDCHAWSSLMLYEFPRKILGVNPSAPGFDEICIEPLAFYVKDAEGTVCVPDGTVYVKRSVINNVLHLTVDPQCPQPVFVKLPNGTQKADNYKASSYEWILP